MAFVLQTQLAASHFHLAAFSKAATLADAGKAAPDKQQKKLPSEDECPICQQLSGAHNVLIYVAVALALPNISAAPAAAFPDETAPVPLIVRNWQSRAPPL